MDVVIAVSAAETAVATIFIAVCTLASTSATSQQIRALIDCECVWVGPFTVDCKAPLSVQNLEKAKVAFAPCGQSWHRHARKKKRRHSGAACFGRV